MIVLHYSGWFQCRLSTDPDPYDEHRGVSGYVHAYANEPDLDRVLHWQPPSFVRTGAPGIGVQVRTVSVDGAEAADDHPFVGASVNLLNAAKFEGRNGVIADDGYEPIYPFHLQVVAGNGAVLERSTVPLDPEAPYSESFAPGVEMGPGVAAEVAAATGISNIRKVWEERIALLEELVSNAQGAELVALRERIPVLSRWLITPKPGVFFGARMQYDYALRSQATAKGWPEVSGKGINLEDSWQARFWLGGWDADALCGYCQGVLELPTSDVPPDDLSGVRADDRDAVMSGTFAKPGGLLRDRSGRT